MKYIFRNILNFEKTRLRFFNYNGLFFSSAFIMNFSYCLYMNYNTALKEASKDLKDIYPIIVKDEQLTNGEFKHYIDELDNWETAVCGVAVILFFIFISLVMPVIMLSKATPKQILAK